MLSLTIAYEWRVSLLERGPDMRTLLVTGIGFLALACGSPASQDFFSSSSNSAAGARTGQSGSGNSAGSAQGGTSAQGGFTAQAGTAQGGAAQGQTCP